MSRLGQEFGVLVLAGAALAGCMSGRSSLLATHAGGEGAASLSSSPLGEAYPVGPSRGLVAAGVNPSAASAHGARGASLTAPAPSVGSLRVSGALAASTTPVTARTGAAVAITPSLAPAASVGASVAAVSEPLNVAAAAQVRTRSRSGSTVHAAVKVKTPALGAQVHVGG